MTRPRLLLPCLALSMSMSAGACTPEGDENFGLSVQSEGEGPVKAHAVSERQLRDPLRLQQIALLGPNEREITRRLGSHRLSAHTSWRVRPPPPLRPDLETDANPALPTAST